MDKLLLLEDDMGLIDGLSYSLKKNGFELQVVQSVREAKAYIDKQEAFDLLVLDVSLPDGTGFEVCEYVRKKGSIVPILFLTAADEEYNVIRGLDCGGDDYITKPFKLGELCSRIHALLRRSKIVKQHAGSEAMEEGVSGTRKVESEYFTKEDNAEGLPKLRGEDIEVDLLGSRVFYKGKPLDLTAIEYRLLCILLQNKNRIVTRQMILDIMWDGNGNYVDDNTLSVYIRRLREKLEIDPSHPRCLKTARGLGYIWEEKTNEFDKR